MSVVLIPSSVHVVSLLINEWRHQRDHQLLLSQEKMLDERNVLLVYYHSVRALAQTERSLATYIPRAHSAPEISALSVCK